MIKWEESQGDRPQRLSRALKLTTEEDEKGRAGARGLRGGREEVEANYRGAQKKERLE
jgi:hypothetical protein